MIKGNEFRSTLHGSRARLLLSCEQEVRQEKQHVQSARRVCDWSKPGAEQQDLIGTWIFFE